jgi:hypothetical protein
MKSRSYQKKKKKDAEDKREINEETKKELAEARLEYKAGKIHSLEEMKQLLGCIEFNEGEKQELLKDIKKKRKERRY